MFHRSIKLVTHNATFHADEVFATACLRIYYRKNIHRKVKIIRTRDEKIIKKADIVYDVGGIYDPEKYRFDHHQKDGADKRENGVPYSSFGLIWKHFGDMLVSNSQIKNEIDEKFVQQICASDTGAVDFKVAGTDWKAWTFGDVVGLFQAEDREDPVQDKNFFKTLNVAEEILLKIIEKTEKKFVEHEIVEGVYQKAEDKRIIVLEKGMSWRKPLIAKPEPLYVIFPVSNGKYHIQAVPVEDGSYKCRKPFPEEWRGRAEAELKTITGVGGLIFVHNSGFLAVASSLDSAFEVVKLSL